MGFRRQDNAVLLALREINCQLRIPFLFKISVKNKYEIQTSQAYRHLECFHCSSLKKVHVKLGVHAQGKDSEGMEKEEWRCVGQWVQLEIIFLSDSSLKRTDITCFLSFVSPRLHRYIKSCMYR